MRGPRRSSGVVAGAGWRFLGRRRPRRLREARQARRGRRRRRDGRESRIPERVRGPRRGAARGLCADRSCRRARPRRRHGGGAAAAAAAASVGGGRRGRGGGGSGDAGRDGWRLASSENYDAYLAAIGVGRIGRALAKRAPTAQTLSFSFSGASVRIQTDGLLRMDARYEIGGPPVEVAVKGVAFSDRAFRIRAEPIRDSRYGSTRACRNESAKTLSPVVGEPRGAEDRTVPRKLGKRV